MTIREFEQKLKTDNNTNVFLIHGENAFFKARALDMIFDTIQKTNAMMDADRFDEKTAEDDIILACDTLPFIDNKRVVCVENFAPLKTGNKGGDAMTAYIPQVPEHAVLIFYMSENVDKRKKLFKVIQKHGVGAEFSAPTEQEVIHWIMDAFDKEGKKIARREAQMMIALCGMDMVALKGEIDKVSAYVESETITEADIIHVVSKSLEYNVFKLHDFLMQKKLSDALSLFHDIIETEKSPFGVLGLIANKFRLMYKGRALLDANYPQDRAISLMGGHPYAAKIALKECRAFSSSELRDNLGMLADLDYRIKSGQADATLAAERTLLKIYKVIA